MISKPFSVAVIGAGMAGAAVAHALAAAGLAVQVFDKSRGVGGRLATRRVERLDNCRRTQVVGLDHGAWGFEVQSCAFQTFVDAAVRAGCLAPWTPRLAANSLPLERSDTLYVPTPDMPALCRYLLGGVRVNLGLAVDAVHAGHHGWQVRAGALAAPDPFDAVVLALPPAQAASLLNPHRSDWARHAATALMQPCWTLMGISDEPEAQPRWDLMRPPAGLLAGALRNDSRPGRAAVAGQGQWVTHARPGWSRQHLEQPAEWVQQQMQTALDDCWGARIDWLHCTVHRWRYAHAATHASAAAAPFWWDARRGLGVCGDFLGGNGVEGAWLSAQALSAALLQPAAAGGERLAAQRVPADVGAP